MMLLKFTFRIPDVSFSDRILIKLFQLGKSKDCVKRTQQSLI